ncbi:hypothetical protein BMW22_16760 [Rhizobium leguminosarum]|uniref:Uncharacterized protein n=1 Tax=Rhizobium leguminosarum TaxID=384 RepID=A0A1L3ZBQ3_RHILE|nr:hypothetical protein BMW22_16760 [Rhizobium leguminosarum]
MLGILAFGPSMGTVPVSYALEDQESGHVTRCFIIGPSRWTPIEHGLEQIVMLAIARIHWKEKRDDSDLSAFHVTKMGTGIYS